MRILRVFVDTSVFGGMFDPEFSDDTREFFRQANTGRFSLAVSEQVDAEIMPAPLRVRNLFRDFLPTMAYFNTTLEVRRLAGLYVEHGVVGPKSFFDASHVAYATVYGCDGLVSWNFKHIIHPDKSLLFNLVNLEQGYPQLFIASPKEILTDGKNSGER